MDFDHIIDYNDNSRDVVDSVKKMEESFEKALANLKKY